MSVASAAAEAVTGSATTAASKEVGAAAAKAADNWFSKGIGWVGNNPGRAAAYGGVGLAGAYGLSYVNPMLDKRDRGTIAGGFKTALGVGALAGAGFGAHYLWKGRGASGALDPRLNTPMLRKAARDPKFGESALAAFSKDAVSNMKNPTLHAGNPILSNAEIMLNNYRAVRAEEKAAGRELKPGEVIKDMLKDKRGTTPFGVYSSRSTPRVKSNRKNPMPPEVFSSFWKLEANNPVKPYRFPIF